MNKKLPLVRLGVIQIFIDEFRRRGGDLRQLLDVAGLPSDTALWDKLFVSPYVVYETLERAAEEIGDLQFGYKIGRSSSLDEWLPASYAMRVSQSVVELFSRFTLATKIHASSAEYTLVVASKRSSAGFERKVHPPVRPNQIDAFYAGLFVRFLSCRQADNLDPGQILVRVCEPKCVDNHDQALRIAQSDESGMKIEFPSEWLLLPVGDARQLFADDASSSDSMPDSLIESVRGALRPHVHKTSLDVSQSARICGYDARRLSRDLRRSGTTIGKIVADLRCEEAKLRLVSTNSHISQIAELVGYSDATAFSRAFKNWTGESPMNYRKVRTASGNGNIDAGRLL